VYQCSVTDQNFMKSMKERCGCDCRRQYIADRLSQKDSKYFVLDKMRQDKDQRNQQDQFS
jgi:hypothetical protein